MERYSDSTLLHMTKSELLEQVRIAEHNRDVMEQQLNQQYENVKDWAPVRHGRWVLHHVGAGHYWECSVCRKNPCIYVTRDTNYCPNCGAKMDEEAQE